MQMQGDPLKKACLSAGVLSAFASCRGYVDHGSMMTVAEFSR